MRLRRVMLPKDVSALLVRMGQANGCDMKNNRVSREDVNEKQSAR